MLLIKGINKTIKNEAKEEEGGFLSILLGTLGANFLGNLLNGKSHHLTNFEIQKYYQNKPKFNGVYSRNNLPKTKDGAYLINLDEYKSIGTHWIALYVNVQNVTYLVALELNIFQKKLENSLEIKMLRQIFIEYKHTIR